MALTPDEVERRTFPIADWGYERGEVHKFLVEVAATLRYALHSTFPAVTVVAPAGAAPTPAPAEPTETADLAHLGDQVNDVLRAAESLGSSVREQAEAEATEIRARAELEAADRRREVELEVTDLRDQAKRVLQAAEQQAAALVAEAERRAQDTVRGAVDQGRLRAERIERRAERHADQVRRYEADVHERLTEARADLERAIARLTGSPDEPVLDLSTERPGVRIGSMTPGEPVPTPAEPSLDPTARLMKAAVGRALDHATGRSAGQGPATPPLPVPDERPADTHAADEATPAGS